jgi:hypothetical protein
MSAAKFEASKRRKKGTGCGVGDANPPSWPLFGPLCQASGVLRGEVATGLPLITTKLSPERDAHTNYGVHGTGQFYVGSIDAAAAI